jgi:hypothetical protein
MESKTDATNFMNEVNDMVSKLKVNEFKDGNDLLKAILPLIQLASKYTKLSGATKKQLVIDSIKLVLSKSNMDDTLRTSLLLAADTLVPPLIDKIYLDDFKKLFSCCC